MSKLCTLLRLNISRGSFKILSVSQKPWTWKVVKTLCSVYQVVSILIINDIIVAVKTRKYFQSLKNLCPERWSSLSALFVKLHLNMSKFIGKILSVYQKPLPWKVVYSKAILYIRYFNRAKANQTWLSLASIAAPISQKREL